MKTITSFLLILTITFTTICMSQINCDDFTNSEEWPENTYTDEGIIGYSQDGTFPIINETDAYTIVNGTEDGIYGVGTTTFNFDGSYQSAKFTIYGLYDQFNEMGFNVSAAESIFLDAEFPVTLGSISIDLDSLETIEGWTRVNLTFTGEIDAIHIINFESGITKLCVEKLDDLAFDCTSLVDSLLFENATYFGEEVVEGELLGYTQEGTQAVTIGSDGEGFCEVQGTYPGIYGADVLIDFNFDGTDQTARFTLYGIVDQFDQMAFRVNDNEFIAMDDSFPMTIDGVTISLDLSPEDEGSWEYYELTFSGNLSTITHKLFESGITNVCIQKEETVKLPTAIINQYVLYPNPIVNNLTITTEQPIDNVLIYTLSGKLTHQIQSISKKQIINLSELPSGIYIVKSIFKNGDVTSKRIIKR